jgi:transcriptional regulator with XRE-family HTH domain
MKKAHSYSGYTVEAAKLLGTRIGQGRRERRWSAQELADRVGISRATLSKVEAGNPSVGLGVALEAAALVGVPLFEADPDRLRLEADRARDRLALLPRRIRPSGKAIVDDF